MGSTPSCSGGTDTPAISLASITVNRVIGCCYYCGVGAYYPKDTETMCDTERWPRPCHIPKAPCQPKRQYKPWCCDGKQYHVPDHRPQMPMQHDALQLLHMIFCFVATVGDGSCAHEMVRCRKAHVTITDHRDSSDRYITISYNCASRAFRVVWDDKSDYCNLNMSYAKALVAKWILFQTVDRCEGEDMFNTTRSVVRFHLNDEVARHLQLRDFAISKTHLDNFIDVRRGQCSGTLEGACGDL